MKELLIFPMTFLSIYIIISFIIELIKKHKEKIVDPHRIICPHCKYVFTLYQRNTIFSNMQSVIDQINNQFHFKEVVPNMAVISCIKCGKRFYFIQENGKIINSIENIEKFLD